MKYRLLNNITGWIVFAIAAFTYISTVEPTASLWDCSEFILSAYKLEVGHPPGAPLFAMLGHLFTMFASPENAAYMANIFSALCSALTILFLFWSITHLARRIVNKNISELSVSEIISETIVTISCGVVGALIYTFSDTFWFSAVEGEVYASSSLITALVFWAILKWEEQADTEYANRWLILIAYITGLSIGVHLLNLLVVPAIIFVYYFKKYKVTSRGIVWTSIISIILLAVLVWGIIPLTPVVASWFEIIFVNSFGLPINSGLLFFVVALTALLSYAIYYTHLNGKVLLNTIFLGLAFCFLGFGSYAMIIIRSSADTPMNQNRPDNVFSLIKYINREQYGSNPLFKGAYYNNADNYEVIMKNTYVRLGDKYIKDALTQQVFKNTALFPRMWSNRKQSHIDTYKTYVTGNNPTFADNIAFFVDYQMGFMYWRYFMWNFVGRQNDMQATKYDLTKGNWLSGIKFIDEARLGTMDNMPKYYAENKGTNKYYFLPLLLGILGLLYQLKKDKKGFSVITLLFFFTGIAIIIYLNQTPDEPRERDYAYAGSFYAFAIWTGLGIACLYRLLAKVLKEKIAAPMALLLGLSAPAIMAQQNWDDHDRSGRYIATDFGYNYLISCEKNAILYTFGDIDTFSSWYNQEVEGVRTDIKIINYMYLEADWYYMQMMKRTYEAAPLITTATPEKIIGEMKTPAPIKEIRPSLYIKQALGYFFNDKSPKVKLMSGHEITGFPSKNLLLPIDRAKVIEQGIARDTNAIVQNIPFKITANWISRSKLGALDFAANNFHDRPIYYGGRDEDFIMGAESYLRDEGVAKRLVPENTDRYPIDVDKTFDLLVNKYRYRGLNDPDVHIDETTRQQMIPHYRMSFFGLAEYLRVTGDTVRLKQLMEKYHEVLPEMERVVASSRYTMYMFSSNPLVENYFYSGLTEYAVSLAQRLTDEYVKEFNYYAQLSYKTKSSYKNNIDSDVAYSYRGLTDLLNIVKRYNQPELQKQIEKAIEELRS